MNILPKTLRLKVAQVLRRVALASLVFAFVASNATPSSAQEALTGQLVVPNVNALQPGSSSDDVPFQGNDTWLMQTYSASQFAPLINGGYITAVSFRSQEALPLGFDVTYSHFELQLATFSQPISNLDRTDDPGKYADSSLVFSADNVRLSGSSSTSPSVPAPFGIKLQLQHPFYYDPAAGNLLMYMQSGSVLGGIGDRVDSEDRLNPPVGYLLSKANSMVGDPAFPAAIVAQFDYTSIPEPNGLSLAIMGFMLAGFIRLARQAPGQLPISALALVLCLSWQPTCHSQERQQGQVIVPNADATRPGPSFTIGPFQGDMYILQAYDASQFSILEDGVYLTGLSFRSDEGSVPFDGTYGHLEVQLATLPRPINTVETKFSPGNYPDSAVAFSRDNVQLSGRGSTVPELPAPFDIGLKFDKPFFYDPRAGNLLLYLRVADRRTFGSGYAIDMDQSVSPPPGYLAAGFNDGRELGRADASLVVRFDYSAIPEPRATSVIVFGAVLLGFFRPCR